MKAQILFLMGILNVTTGCISFKATDIKAGTKTFYVEEFSLSSGAGLAPADIGITFSEKLKEKIRSDSQLYQDETNPHLNFTGEITSFKVTSEAPSGNNESSDLQRLYISVKVNFQDVNYPKDNFEKTFYHDTDFDATASLLDVQEQLINEIFNDITLQVFNAAFSNW